MLLDAVLCCSVPCCAVLSLRFNIGTDVLERAKEEGELGLAAVFVWFRFMATRQLVWNNNYNVKPR